MEQIADNEEGDFDMNQLGSVLGQMMGGMMNAPEMQEYMKNILSLQQNQAGNTGDQQAILENLAKSQAQLQDAFTEENIGRYTKEMGKSLGGLFGMDLSDMESNLWDTEEESEAADDDQAVNDDDKSFVSAELNEKFHPRIQRGILTSCVPLDWTGIFDEKQKTENTIIGNSVNFSSVPVITDAILYSWAQNINAFRNVKELRIRSCQEVTDVGLKWLGILLKQSGKILKISLDGCSNITEHGLLQLLEPGVHRFLSISVCGTSIVFSLKDLWGSHGIDMELSPAYTIDSATSDNAGKMTERHSRIVVCPPEKLVGTVIPRLTGQAVATGSCHYNVTCLDGWKLSWVEAPPSHIVFDLFTRGRVTHIVIPVDLTDDVVAIKFHIMTVLAKFVTKDIHIPELVQGPNFTVRDKSAFHPGGSIAADFDAVSGMLRTDAGSSSYPHLLCRTNFSRQNHSFTVEVVKASSASLKICLGATYFTSDFSEYGSEMMVKFQEPAKAGEVWTIGIKHPEKLPYNEIQIGTVITIFIRCDQNKVYHEKEHKCETSLRPCIFASQKNTVLKIHSIPVPGGTTEEELGKMSAVRRQPLPHFIMKNVLYNIYNGIISYEGENDEEDMTVWRSGNSVSKSFCRLELEIIAIPASDEQLAIGAGTEILDPQSALGSNSSSIGWQLNQAKILSGRRSKDAVTATVGDRIAIEMTNFDDEYLTIDTPATVTFYKNNEQVGQMQWTCRQPDVDSDDEGDEGLPPRILFMICMSKHDSCFRVCDYIPPHFINKNAKFLQMRDTNLLLTGSQLSLPEGDSSRGSFIACTEISRDNPKFTITIDEGHSEAVAVLLGLVHSSFSEKRDPSKYLQNNWFWDLKDGLIKTTPAAEGSKQPASVGDTLAIHLVNAEFDQFGFVKPNQTIKLVRFKNNIQVDGAPVSYKYMGGGLHPMVHISRDIPPAKVTLKEYYDIPLSNILVKGDKEEGEGATTSMAREGVELNMSSGAKFILLPMTADSAAEDKQLLDAKLQELRLPSAVQDIIQTLETQQKLLETLSNEDKIDLQCHREYANIAHAKENWQRLVENWESCVITADLNSRGKELSEFHRVLLSNLSGTYKRTPFTCLPLPPQASDFYQSQLEMLTNMEARDKKIIPLSELTVGANLSTFSKWMQHLHNLGIVLVTEKSSSASVVVDLEWFVKVVWELPSEPTNKTAAAVRCVSTDTPSWKDKHLWKLAMKDSLTDQQMKQTFNTLLEVGHLIKLPSFRQHYTDAKSFIISPSMLGNMPVPLAKFLEVKDNIFTKQEVKFHFATELPRMAFLSLISECIKFCQPLAFGKDGLAFHHGSVEVVIHMAEEGKEVILHGKMFNGDAAEDKTEVTMKDQRIKNAILNALSLYADVISCRLNTWTLVYWRSYSDQNRLTPSGVYCTHQWEKSYTSADEEDAVVTSVCNICGNCSDKGLSCENNGIQGPRYMTCACHTERVCCVNCGICQQCARQLWKSRSALRPCLVPTSSTLVPLNVVTLHEVHFSYVTPLQVSHSQQTSIYLHSKDQKTKIEVHPSRPQICEVGQDLEMSRHHEDLERAELGDTIMLRISELPGTKQWDAPVATEDKQGRRYNFSINNYCRLWQANGLLSYLDGPSTRSVPVALLATLRTINPEYTNHIEIEIIDVGREGTLSVGIVPPNYSSNRLSGMQPGWGADSVGYHADDGGIFFESGTPVHRGPPCSFGDKMGVGVTFQSDEEASLFFTKNGKKIYERNWRALKEGSHHLAVGMHSHGEKALLLDSDMWLHSNAQALKEEEFSYGNIKIRPKSLIQFPEISSAMITEKSIRKTIRNILESGFVYLENTSSDVLVYKVKTTNPKRYAVVPNLGVLTPFRSVGIILSVKVKPGEKDSIKDDKFLIQWKVVTDKLLETDDAKKLWSLIPGEPKSHKLLCGWGKPEDSETGKSESDIIHYLTPASEPPTERSYHMEVLKNGTVAHACWLPWGNYTVHVEGKKGLPTDAYPQYASPFYPTMDYFISNSFMPGMYLLAKVNVKDTDVTEIDEVDKIRSILSGEDTKYEHAFLMLLIVEVRKDGQLVLGASQHNQVLTVKRDSTDIHPLHWFFYTTRRSITLEPWHRNGVINLPSSMKVLTSSANEICVLSDNYQNLMQAPTYLFTEEQRGNCPSIPVWSSQSFKMSQKCAEQDTVQSMQQSLARMQNVIKDWMVPRMDCDCSQILTALPRNLTMDTLMYPTFSTLYDLASMSLHQLCKSMDHYSMVTGEVVNNIAHFMDKKGVDLVTPPSSKLLFDSLLSAWTYASLALSGVRLPEYKNLLTLTESEIKDYHLQVEKFMTSMISQYALYSVCKTYVQDSHIAKLKHEANMVQTLTEAAGLGSEPGKVTDNTDIYNNPTALLNGCCRVHYYAEHGLKVAKKNFKEIFQPYGQLLSMLHTAVDEEDPSLPDNLSEAMCDLEVLIIDGNIKKLPSSMCNMNKLKMVCVESGIELLELPTDIGDCPSLQDLRVPNSLVKLIPTSLTRCHSLINLEIPNTLIKELPNAFGNLKNLTMLNISCNSILALPEDFRDLVSLTSLWLTGVPWIETELGMTFIDFDHYVNWHGQVQQYAKHLSKQTIENMYKEGDTDNNGLLEQNELAEVNAKLFYSVARIGHDYEEGDEMGGFPPQLCALTQLTRLELDYQSIRQVPGSISSLINLQMLSLNHCMLLESLPGSMGHLPLLNTLQLRGCPSLRTPPNEVVGRGTEAVMAYLKRLAGGFTENWRTKLMLVGLGGAGKTSLLRALMSGLHKSSGTTDKEVTDGIDIETWKVKHSSGKELTFSAWDFAGQSVYYNTHQFFLSNRAIYLLLWNSRQGYEHAGLEFWLSSIKCHAPKAPVFVIGTHADQVPKADIPRDMLKKTYPQINSFHLVSSLTGKGMVQLEEAILDATYQESYMGEKVPQVYLDLETKIVSSRGKEGVPVLRWEAVKEYAVEVGIYDDKDIGRAVQFLHDLGTVQYFDTDFLRENVVIDPQWIVDVMACVVSIKDSPIKEGRLAHEDIPQVWSRFPADLHQWLLKLTEAFDLTFPIPDQPVNLIPCLVPQEEPNYSWPDIDKNPDWRETNMVYKFDYLPAGLFNRTQVRLFQFSDSEAIWKRGSVLHKNGHHAVIKQHSDTELTVQVIGPRPENILFLVHEVIESLIAESFHGVSYDYLVPCPDCIRKCGANDAHMFSCSLVRQAQSWNAPFIQCRKYFHIISMAILQAVMPPDSSSEFDAHLQTSVQTLADLRLNIEQDIFIAFCPADLPQNEQEYRDKVHPATITQDLQKAGYNCWYRENMWDLDVSERVLALQGSKLLVVCMSSAFEREDICREFCLYALESLNKPYVVISVGKTYDWRQTHTGYVLGSDTMFISMKEVNDFCAKIYPEKKDKLLEAVAAKLESIEQIKNKSSEVFLSYCWTNSQDAVNKGTRPVEGALGAVDPRNLKREIEKRGLSVWLDIEQTGQRGLFEDITVGIRDSKVVVACVSTQYETSKNCMMELRFAACIMNKPIVYAVVGTGDDWKWTEIGALMMGVKAPVVSLQKSSDPALFDEITSLAKKLMPKDETPHVKENKPKKTATQLDLKNISFKEELELAQRKFQRHLAMLANNMATVPFPYLVILDFMDDTLMPVEGSRVSVREDGNTRPKTANSRSKAQELLVSASVEQSLMEQPMKKMKKGVSMKKGGKKKAIERRQTSKLNQGTLDPDDWLYKTLCCKVLCEDDKGWHLSSTVIEMSDLTPKHAEQLVKSVAPYLIRMYVLLRHSHIPLTCLMESHKSYIDYIKEIAQESEQDFGQAYCLLREAAIKYDVNRSLADLARCHLPTGKVKWLCEGHRACSHIRVLNTDIAVGSGAHSLVDEADVMLRDAILRQGNLREPYRIHKNQHPRKDACVQDSADNQKIEPRPPSASKKSNTTRRKKSASDTNKAKSGENVKPAEEKQQNVSRQVSVTSHQSSRPSSVTSDDSSKRAMREDIRRKFKLGVNAAQAASTLSGQATSKACLIL